MRCPNPSPSANPSTDPSPSSSPNSSTYSNLVTCPRRAGAFVALKAREIYHRSARCDNRSARYDNRSVRYNTEAREMQQQYTA